MFRMQLKRKKKDDTGKTLTLRKLILAGIFVIVLPYLFIILMGALANQYLILYDYTTFIFYGAIIILVVLLIRFCLLVYQYRKRKCN